MKIHEYQAKELFRQFGIPAPEGEAVEAAAQALPLAKQFGFPVVLKAQVHAGGRGKAGGVKLVHRAEEVVPAAEQILALTIKDLPVRKLLVTPAAEIAQEVYLSILIDRAARKAIFIGCADGGIEIEVTAKEAPEKILRLEVPAAQLRDMPKPLVTPFAEKLFSEPGLAAQAGEIMVHMARMFTELDASLIEINPLIADTQGRVIALDAKVTFDDNALFRHPGLEALRDMGAEDPDELTAKAEGLSFIRLTGSIGCMVNGAGLAMATMDTIKYFDGEPANFLDVGGSSNPQKVVAAFKTILKDPGVRVILINIFGGITRCDDIAKGILASLSQMDVRAPIVIRLRGTNEEEGLALLQGTQLITAHTLSEGAQKAVEIGA